MLWYTVFVSILCSVSGLNFERPDPKCDAKDFHCLTELVKKLFIISLTGDAEIDAASLDPLHHKIIEQNDPDMQFTLTDSVVTGLKDSSINGVTITEENKKAIMHVDITLSHYEMNGNYKLNGKLGTLLVTGDGKYNFKATNINVLVHAVKEHIEKDGKIYLKLVKIKTETKVLGTMHYDLENLFNGNKELSEPVLKFINDNPKEVAELIQDTITLANINKIFDNCNKVLAIIPLEEYIIHNK